MIIVCPYQCFFYQEHCHNMMLDPAWEIVAEDILGFILV